MGIEKFFNKLNKKYANITAPGGSDPKKIINSKNKCDATHLYLDFTGYFYMGSSKTAKYMNDMLLYKIAPIARNGEGSEEYMQNLIRIMDPILSRHEGKTVEYLIKNTTIEEFKAYGEKHFDSIVVDMVKYLLVEELKENFDSSKLNYIGVFLDGIPSGAKIKTQIQRKYTTILLDHVREKIFNQYIKYNQSHNSLFKKYNFDQNTSGFSPGTKFIDEAQRRLLELDSALRTHFPRLNSGKSGFEVAPYTQVGEAEMKIIHKMDSISFAPTEKHVFAGSDADIVILAMIYSGKGKHFNIYRTYIVDNEEKHIEYNVDILVRNIKTFIQTKVSSFDIDLIRLKHDLAFLFTIFGNDFLPRIITMDIEYIFDSILIAYGNSINTVNIDNVGDKKYLVFHNGTNFELSFNVFNELIKELKELENNNLNGRCFREYLNNLLPRRDLDGPAILNLVNLLPKEVFDTKEEHLNANISKFSDLLLLLQSEIKNLNRNYDNFQLNKFQDNYGCRMGRLRDRLVENIKDRENNDIKFILRSHSSKHLTKGIIGGPSDIEYDRKSDGTIYNLFLRNSIITSRNFYYEKRETDKNYKNILGNGYRVINEFTSQDGLKSHCRVVSPFDFLLFRLGLNPYVEHSIGIPSVKYDSTRRSYVELSSSDPLNVTNKFGIPSVLNPEDSRLMNTFLMKLRELVKLPKPILDIIKSFKSRGLDYDIYSFLMIYYHYYNETNKFVPLDLELNIKDENHFFINQRLKNLPYAKIKGDVDLELISQMGNDYDKKSYELDKLHLCKYSIDKTNLGITKQTVDYLEKELILKGLKFSGVIEKYEMRDDTLIEETKTETIGHDFSNLREAKNINPVMVKLCEEYIQGLVWVLDYYFNDNFKTNISTWSYNFNIAPMISQLFKLLKFTIPINVKKGLIRLNQEYFNYLRTVGGLNNDRLVKYDDRHVLKYNMKPLNSYIVPISEYLTPTEHFIYTTHLADNPISILKDDQKEYGRIIIRDIFSSPRIKESLEGVAESLINKRSVKDKLDCTAVVYLSKCYIKSLDSYLPTLHEYLIRVRRLRPT